MIPLYPETDVPAAHTTATSRHRCLRLGGALLALAVLLQQVLTNGPVARLDHLLEHTLAGHAHHTAANGGKLAHLAR